MNEIFAYFSSNFALIHLNGHWYFCILKGPKNTQIDTLNFTNPNRVEQMKLNFFKDQEPVDEKDWDPEFQSEVKNKILEKGEAYRKFLESDAANLVVGYTTDTLTAVPNTPEKIDAILAAIQELIEVGNSSAYLRFSA